MLNMHYFKSQIEDELCGAKCYVKKALETKPYHPVWAKQFLDMSDAELNHATGLYHMCKEYYKEMGGSYSTIPDYLEECMKDIVDCYVETSAKIKHMQDMYNA